MSIADEVFLNNLRELKKNGIWDEHPRPRYADGELAHSIFITDVYQKFDTGIVPVVSVRKTAWKTGIREIMAIYQKPTHIISELEALKVGWWKDWDIGDGTIGHRYGYTVKSWDLMNKLLNGLKANPFGRRHILNLYQESDLEETEGLYPCAFLTMWNVRKNREGELFLDCSLIQRSSDYMTASSINTIQYKALQLMVAKHLGCKAGTFSHHIMNLHCYDRHLEQLDELLLRKGQSGEPELKLNVPAGTNFYDIQVSDFSLENYHPQAPQLSFELAI